MAEPRENLIPHPVFSPLSPALSQKFKATDVYGVPITYKTVGWFLLERQRLKKGPYLEPFYNQVERKTCIWKILENTSKK